MTARLAEGPAHSRAPLLRIDVAAAIAMCAVGAMFLPDHLSTSALVGGGVASMVAATTVAWRRLAPFAASLVAIVATLVCQRVTHQRLSDVPPFALILDTYTAGATAVTRRQAGRLAGLVAGLLAGLTLLASAAGQLAVSVIVKAALPVIVAPVLAGGFVAWRRNLTYQLEFTRALLEDEQERRIALAAVNERNRLALDLHDVVTHAVSVMVIQAGAARVLLADEPAAVMTRLERIITVGRDAIEDLRKLVGSGSAVESTELPAAGWEKLHDLGRRMSDSGLRTDVAIDGDLTYVGEAVRALIHRVVQEALTNAVRHGGAGTAVVSVKANERCVDVRVISRGGGSEPVSAEWDRGGRGLAGIRERVQRNGGETRIGELPDGSFEVWGRLPLLPAHPDGTPRVGLTRPGRWRPSPQQGRLTFAAASLIALELDAVFSAFRRGPLAANCVAVAVMAVLMLWRERWPLVVCLAITGLAVPLSGGLTDMTQATIVSTFVFVIPIYSVAAWAEFRPALVGLGSVLSATVGVGVWHGVGVAVVADNSVLSVGLWVVGRLVRSQRQLSADLTAASGRLLAERASREQQTAATERIRVLRELRASVLRDITTMVALADAMYSVAGCRQPGADAERLRSIEATGRIALTNLREILGALRPAAGAEVPASLGMVPA